MASGAIVVLEILGILVVCLLFFIITLVLAGMLSPLMASLILVFVYGSFSTLKEVFERRW